LQLPDSSSDWTPFGRCFIHLKYLHFLPEAGRPFLMQEFDGARGRAFNAEVYEAGARLEDGLSPLLSYVSVLARFHHSAISTEGWTVFVSSWKLASVLCDASDWVLQFAGRMTTENSKGTLWKTRGISRNRKTWLLIPTVVVHTDNNTHDAVYRTGTDKPTSSHKNNPSFIFAVCFRLLVALRDRFGGREHNLCFACQGFLDTFGVWGIDVFFDTQSQTGTEQ